MNWIDNNLGLHGRALTVRAAKAEVIAANIANADTPRYRARDLDFSAALEAAEGARRSSLHTTHSRHFSGPGGVEAAMTERGDERIGPDGNTVQVEVEKSAYAENAVKFQASAQFFDGTLRGLRKALTGE
jgi:flagellar basal-body rod protein FlgB